MPGAPELELFFDLTSPWTWLAVRNLVPLADRLEAEIVWRPILVGGVFNAVNRAIYETRANPVPVKARYYDKDLADWARLAGLEIHFPPACGHPVNAVLAMRCALAMQARGKLVPFAFAAFDALWRQERDLADRGVLAPLIEAQGENPDTVFAEAESEGIKAQLRTNTDELIGRGGFGSPTMFVNRNDMYFGNDRLPLIEAAIIRRRSAQAA